MKNAKSLLSFMVFGLSLSITSCSSEYTITFDTNDGSEIANVVVAKKDAVGAVTNPTKEGFNFAGWYLDEALSEAVDLATYVPTSDTTVYAKWTIESLNVKFEENGGSTVQDIVVDYGSIVTMPTNPTKEGCDFVRWYKDASLTSPYTNTAIKEDTTLYAKWKSALTYTGTLSGEATYDSEEKTYSFEVELAQWGRFTLYYHGNVISSNDSNLTITGVFNDQNTASGNYLYCDVPENGTEIDYTTFLTGSGGKYKVTYDPENNILDFEDITPVETAPSTGVYYRYGYPGSFSSFTEATYDDTTDTYSFTQSMAAWRMVIIYVDGVEIKYTDVTISGDGWLDGSYNSSVNGCLYVDLENNDPSCFIRGVGNDSRDYTFTYSKTNNTLDIDNLSVEPTVGVKFVYTDSSNTPVTLTVDDMTVNGTTYEAVIRLDRWRYVSIFKDDVALKNTELEISGDGWNGGDANNSGQGELYIDSDPTHFLRSQLGLGNYKITYNSADDSLIIDNLLIGNGETIPTSGVYFTYTHSRYSGSQAFTVYPLLSDITESNGSYSITVNLGQWRSVSIYKDGVQVNISDLTVSGDGWVDGTYDNSTNGSLYINESGLIMRSQENFVDYTLTYNPTDNTLIIDNLSID